MSQVGDYNIANASGASVRSDLNAVFDAIKTNNSGGSDPSNTEAFMFYADSGDNNLKVRNSANNGFTTIGSVNETNLGLLPRAGGTMTGALLGDDASDSSAPAYAFDNDSDTGMFRSGANTIGFSTSGTTRVSISDSGLDMTNALPIRFQDSSGAPFVAIKSPSSLSGDLTLTLPGTVTNGAFLQTDASGNLSFAIVAGVPTGSVFCMAVATIPTGYLECDGSAVSRTTYSALFAIIGTAYGTGDGSSTFNLPDLRGEFIRGFDNGKGTDNGRAIASAQTGDNQSHSHSYTNTSITVSGADHDHGIKRLALNSNTNSGHSTTLGSGQSYYQGFSNSSLAGGNQIVSDSGGLSMTGTVGITISNQGSESRPRNIAMMYVIKI
tara:strand:- start:553 stop:1695 length:1143 start_codon:yes stop_codon:yes gene_type:complete